MAKVKETKPVEESTESQSKVRDKPAPILQREYSDFLGTYKDMSETTSKVVKKAATVLETEIAAGIKAAKKAEEQFLNVEKTRGEKPDEIMQRFRRDAHEVVDILIDVISVGLKSVGNITNVVSIRDRSAPSKPEQSTSGSLPVISPQHAVKAGSSVEVPISFENNGDTTTEEFKLYSTDLVGNLGQRISSTHIQFNPPALKIGPHLTEKVSVNISVPRATPQGIYNGLVLASNMDQLRSEIVVKVD
jgi:hypothetical protein